MLNYPIIFVMVFIVSIVIGDLVFVKRNIFKGGFRPFFKILLILVAISSVYFVIELFFLQIFPSQLEIINKYNEIISINQKSTSQSGLDFLIFLFVLVLTFYLSGLVDYSVHRFFSHSKKFFFTHEYHHISKIVSVIMPGIGTRPYSFLTMLPTIFATLGLFFVLGKIFNFNSIYFKYATYVLIIQGAILIISHSIFLRDFHLLNKILQKLHVTSPAEHIFHHGVDSMTNFGNFTTIWDKFFGTYTSPNKKKIDELKTGLSYESDFLSAISAGKLHLPRKLINEEFSSKLYN